MRRIDQVKGTFESRIREKKPRASAATIRRLPRYHRYLANLLEEGTLRISSSALAEKMNVTASQIRQDLSCFGDFGQQGYGYNVKYLYRKIEVLLGIDKGYRAILVGVGNMGQALLRSRMFARRGVKCLAAFDARPDAVGTQVAGVPVYDVEELDGFLEREKVDMAVLTLPADAAVAMAERLAERGVGGILNFTNAEIPAHLSLVVENVHLDDFLMLLCFRMGEKGEAEDE